MLIIGILVLVGIVFWYNYESPEDKEARIAEELKAFEAMWDNISTEMKEEVYQDFKKNMDRYEEEKK